MAAFVEVWGADGLEVVRLDGERVTVGRADENDIVLADDKLVSALHAVLTKYGAGWCIRDLDSTNGTRVNGDRLWAEHPLEAGDEVVVGATRILYRDDRSAVSTTQTATPPPELTAREREVLVALCRPILARGAFTAPAAVRTIAEELFISQSAVKQQLTNLYRKFKIPEGGDRRVELANAAVQTGAIGLADLQEWK